MHVTRKKVLIVDDNPMNLKLLQIALNNRDLDIVSAGSAEDALALIDKTPPDLILLDIRLPGMDGLELSRRLRARPETRSVGIFAVTAYASPEEEERAFAAGCDRFIRKPINTRTLPKMVTRFLDAADAGNTK